MGSNERSHHIGSYPSSPEIVGQIARESRAGSVEKVLGVAGYEDELARPLQRRSRCARSGHPSTFSLLRRERLSPSEYSIDEHAVVNLWKRENVTDLPNCVSEPRVVGSDLRADVVVLHHVPREVDLATDVEAIGYRGLDQAARRGGRIGNARPSPGSPPRVRTGEPVPCERQRAASASDLT